jgi:serine/threonine protein kinase/HEAT repeat protein
MDSKNFKAGEKEETKVTLTCPECGKPRPDLGATDCDSHSGECCECLPEGSSDKNESASPPPSDMNASDPNTKFTVVEKLGEGGMATVFKVRDSGKREMAMKVMNSDVASNKVAIKRFVKEVSIVSNLTHPNIAQVYGCFTPDEGNPYMMMEYVDGVTLAEIIKHEHHLSQTRAIDICIQVCEALQHAHSKHIIHRDLKPSNIIVTENTDGSDSVKLVDFGIAKSAPSHGGITELTQKGEVFGSPFCMSPEQCKGLETDARSDIYSLGCVMVEVLTGETVFKGDNSIQILLHHVNTPVKSAMEKLKSKGVSIQLCAVIDKMLAKKPPSRYQSVAEVLSDLERIKQRKTPSVIKKKRFLVAAGIMSTVAIIAFAAIASKGLFTSQVGYGTGGPGLQPKPLGQMSEVPAQETWTIPKPNSDDPEAWIDRVKRAEEEGFMGHTMQMQLSPTERRYRMEETNRIFRESQTVLEGMGPRIIPTLVKHLNDEVRVSNMCADLLVAFGTPSVEPVTELVRRTVGSTNCEQAEMVLTRLAPLSNPSILKLIQSSDQEQRRAGAILLAAALLPLRPDLSARIQFRDTQDQIQRAHNFLSVRRAIPSQYQQDLGLDPSQIDIIKGVLAKEQDANIRANLTVVLSELATQNQEMAPLLTNLLKNDRSAIVRANAIAGLGVIMSMQSNEADKGLVQTILAGLKHDPDSQVRIACLDTLQANITKAPYIVPQLKEATHDVLDAVHQKALQALCQLYPEHPECRSAVDEAFKESDEATVRAAIDAVGRMGREGSSHYVPALIRALNGHSARTAVETLRSLGETAAPQAVPAMISVLQTNRWPEKMQIIDALPSMGPRAKKAIPELQRIIGSDEPYDRAVRNQATRALAQLKNM